MVRATLLGAAALAAVVVLWLVYAYDPSTAGFFPLCPFHWLTGLNCPGCGATRATHALLHGDVAGAFAFNPLFVVAFPFLLGWLVYEALSFAGLARKRYLPPKAIYGLVALLIAYGVIRNLIHV